MDWLLRTLYEPLAFEFARNALLAGGAIGILCGLVGTLLIVQRMSLLSDVVSHSVFPGLAIAYLLRLDMFLGALISGLASTFVVSAIRTQTRVKVDAAMAIVFSGFFALGLCLLSVLRAPVDLEGFLFGNILSVSQTDVQRAFAILGFTLLAIAACYRELFFYTFDPLGAQVAGLPVRRLEFGMMFLVTIAIVASLRTAGGLLAISLLIAPGTAAYLLVRRLSWMMVLAAGIGVLSTTIGLYASYYLNIPSGPAIALVSTSCFVISLLFSPSQGVVSQRLARWLGRQQPRG